MAHESASAEQVSAYKQKVYNAYQNNDLSSALYKRSGFIGDIVRRMQLRQIQNIVSGMSKQKSADVALGLKGDQLWNYAVNQQNTQDSVADNVQRMYNEAMQVQKKRAFEKFGGIAEKLGD